MLDFKAVGLRARNQDMSNTVYIGLSLRESAQSLIVDNFVIPCLRKDVKLLNLRPFPVIFHSLCIRICERNKSLPVFARSLVHYCNMCSD